jgi:hypothetical protein
MVNPLQRTREETMKWIRKELAKGMPKGIPDIQFRAFLQLKFTPRKTDEYLSTMSDAGLIENVAGMWFILDKK